MKDKNRFLSYFLVLVLTFLSVFGLLYGSSSIKGDSSKSLIDAVSKEAKYGNESWFSYATRIDTSKKDLVDKSNAINRKFYNYRNHVIPVERDSVKYSKNYYSFSNINFLNEEDANDFNATSLKLRLFDKEIFYNTDELKGKKALNLILPSSL